MSQIVELSSHSSAVRQRRTASYLAARRPVRLVGRDRELARLTELRQQTIAGNGSVVALVGEPGIGKTALAQACLAGADAEGFVTAWGAGWPAAGAPPLWPWQDVLTQLGARDLANDLDADMLDQRTDHDDRVEADASAVFHRYRLVARAIDRIADRRVLIVIDDAHLTDPPTLQLARFVARSMRNRPMMLVVTCVAVPEDRSTPAAEALTELFDDAERIELAGLDQDALTDLVLHAHGRRGTIDTSRLADLTGGNPLLVREALLSGDAVLDGSVPDGIRRLLRRPINGFDSAERLVLAAVAVLGGLGDPGEIATVAATSRDTVLRVCRTATRLGVLRPAITPYDFTHGLLRETLLTDLGDDQLADLRDRAADALASRPGHQPSEHRLQIAELRLAVARHRGGAAWDAAIEATRIASRIELPHFGPREAAPLLRRACATLADAGRDIPADVLVDLGRAEFASGRLLDSRAAYQQAVYAATGDPVAVAEAVAGLGGLSVFEHRAETEIVWFRSVLAEAIAGLGDHRPDLRARLLARQAAEAWFEGRGRLEAVMTAVGDGTDHDDACARAETLSLLHHVLMGPEHAERRRQIADELIELSPRTDDAFLALMGPMWRTLDLVLAGDHAAHRALLDLRQHSDALRMHAVLYVVEVLETMLLMRDGRLSEAELAATRAFEHGAAIGEADAGGYYAAQLMVLRWLQHRSAEIVDVARQVTGQPTLLAGDEVYAAAFAAIAAMSGEPHRHEAQQVLDRIRLSGLERIPSSSNWLVTVTSLVEAASALGDAAMAAAAYDLLLPHADLPAMGSLGSVCLGSVHRSLGLAAATLGRLDGAIDHLSRAVDDTRRIGNRPVAAIVEGELALSLLRRHAPGDRAAAVEHLDAAVTALDNLGLTARADALRAASAARFDELADDGADAAAGERAAGPGDGSNRALAACRLRRRERSWEVVGLGERAEVRDSAGLHYLARLIDHPDVEIAAGELAGSRVTSFHQEVLDDATRAAYRRRADELLEELQHADRTGDERRSARAQAELDQLLGQLRAQTRLDGRSRAFTDTDERARTAVQKAIRRNLERIARQAPALGAALTASIRTGLYCRYEPDGEHDWQISE